MEDRRDVGYGFIGVEAGVKSWRGALASAGPAAPVELPAALLRSEEAAVLPQLAHAHALSRQLGRPLSAANRVSALVGGPQTYAAMFDAIAAAQDHINIQTSIISSEGAGRELAERLLERHRQGVLVHLLSDGIAPRRRGVSVTDALRRAGMVLCERPRATPLDRLLRRHDEDRTLMVADGRTGFVGGVHGAGSSAFTPARDERSHGWHDTHLRVEGPAVAELQLAFIRQWRRTTSLAMGAGAFFPELSAVGVQRVGVAASNAGRGHNPFHGALVAAIDTAQHRVLLSSSQFAPTRRLLHALAAAAQRGVEVRLLLPGAADGWMPLQAGRSHYGRLLHAGVHLHERHDGVLHAKTSVIDGVWATVGTSNLDWRSFAHDAQPQLVVLDAGFGSEIEQVFWYDLAHCRELLLDEWLDRGPMPRSMEWLARRLEFLL
jgi:cardiolipin synthase A/B